MTRIFSGVAAIVALLTFAACTSDTGVSGETARVKSTDVGPVVLDQSDRGTVLLARHPEAITAFRVPDSSRAGDVPDRLRLRGFEVEREDGQRIGYRTRLPVVVHHYTDESRDRPPEMRVFDADGNALPFERESDHRIGSPDSWGYRRGEVVVRTRAGRPAPQGLTLEFPMATAAERSLNRALSDRTGLDFVLRTVSTYADRRTGVFLPAPGTVSYRIKPGSDAILRSEVRLLYPAFQDGPPSRGASAVVSVTDGDRTAELFRENLRPGRRAALEVDLSDYAGREVTLRFDSEPGRDADFDYVLFEEPVITSRSAKPGRMLVLFVDTLRRDHLGVYGYGRPTSPSLDRLAAGSVVFDNAWAPSPWTLPSARAAFSGLLPHRWDAQQHAGRALARAGWTTVLVASNSYLSEQFDFDEGWSVYCGNRGRSAPLQVSRAIEYLRRYPEQNVALFVHLIDPHLPYGDDPDTRGTFADGAPPGFQGVVREAALEQAWTDRPGQRESIRQYAIDLYDEQILLVDRQIDRLLAAVGDEATVVVFSDHGEELFENGELGHGHSLSDAQMRVPLFIRAPGSEPRRVAEAVSLVDVGTTLLELAGVAPPDRIDGRSLVATLRGEPLPPAPVALGWNLFREEHWGVVHDGRKWNLGGGNEWLDPGHELRSAEDFISWREAFSRSTGLPLGWAWRVRSPGRTTRWRPPDSRFELTTPVGIEKVWSRLDFYGERENPESTTAGFRIRSTESRRAAAETWAVPGRLSTRGLVVRFESAGVSERSTVDEDILPSVGASITSVGPIRLDWVLVPIRESGPPPRTLDRETRRQLEALGYIR